MSSEKFKFNFFAIRDGAKVRYGQDFVISLGMSRILAREALLKNRSLDAMEVVCVETGTIELIVVTKAEKRRAEVVEQLTAFISSHGYSVVPFLGGDYRPAVQIHLSDMPEGTSGIRMEVDSDDWTEEHKEGVLQFLAADMGGVKHKKPVEKRVLH